MTRSPALTAGYVILGLLGLSDALGFLLATGDDAPPVFINVIGTVCGLATLWALFTIVRATREGAAPARPAVLTLLVSRIVSAVLGVPALFVDISGGVKVFVGVAILLTIVGLLLIRPALAEAGA